MCEWDRVRVWGGGGGGDRVSQRFPTKTSGTVYFWLGWQVQTHFFIYS